MALRRTVRRKTREQGELEHSRDHEARLYGRERGSALLQIAAGATPHAGALTALTGQVNSLEGDLVGRQHVIQFYSHLERTSPAGDLIYVSHDN